MKMFALIPSFFCHLFFSWPYPNTPPFQGAPSGTTRQDAEWAAELAGCGEFITSSLPKAYDTRGQDINFFRVGRFGYEKLGELVKG